MMMMTMMMIMMMITERVNQGVLLLSGEVFNIINSLFIWKSYHCYLKSHFMSQKNLNCSLSLGPALTFPYPRLLTACLG